jgi:hypothetical protein
MEVKTFWVVVNTVLEGVVSIVEAVSIIMNNEGRESSGSTWSRDSKRRR